MSIQPASLKHLGGTIRHSYRHPQANIVAACRSHCGQCQRAASSCHHAPSYPPRCTSTREVPGGNRAQCQRPTLSCCSCNFECLPLSQVPVSLSCSRSACCFAATFESTQRALYSQMNTQPCGSAGSVCFKATSDGASRATRLLKAACASHQACTPFFSSPGCAAVLHSFAKGSTVS